MPLWFSKALGENEKARKNWTALSTSRRKEVLRYFAQVKSPEARARNVARALHVLSGAHSRVHGADLDEWIIVPDALGAVGFFASCSK